MKPVIWDYDCAIIGGGPGGLVSALYLRRFKRSVILVNCGKPRAAWIPSTHNLMGFPRGISGPGILSRLTRQVDRVGAHRVHGEARVKRCRGGFQVDVDEVSLTARKVILATGIQDIQPELANLKSLREAGLLRYCPICDAYEHAGKSIAVIADDDRGLEKALFIAFYSPRLRVIVPERLRIGSIRLKELRDSKVRIERGKIESIEPLPGGRGLVVCMASGRKFSCDVAYPMLGCRVNDKAFERIRGIRRTREGLLITTTEQRLSVPGLFAVGDCVNQIGQLSIAAGQAAIAATTIHNDLL